MAPLRAFSIGFGAFAVFLSACGGGGSPDPSGGGGPGAGGSGGIAPGTGGTGGSEGPGGAGGGGEDGGDPAVEGFFPAEAGRGFRIRVNGKNFHSAAPRNLVRFTRVGTSTPNLEAKGLAAGSDGSWFEVLVPMDAETGPTRVVVDRTDGVFTLDGPVFTVTDATLPPTLSAIEPEVFTLGGPAELTLTGKEFYRERTEVEIGGKPAPVDWSRSNETTLVVSLPASIQDELGEYPVYVVNPAPGGGKAGPRSVRIVEALHLLSVEATGPRDLRAIFDKAVNRNTVSGSFSIAGVPNAIQFSQRLQDQPEVVRLSLRNVLDPGTYTLVVSSQLRSNEGGTVANDRMEFEAFDPQRELLAEIGEFGCGSNAFSDPTGIAIAGDRLYVVERGGNQVQALSLEGSFLGFFGDDGTSFGYHTTGEEPGCAGGTPGPDALSGPLGTPVVTSSGVVLVGDTENGRLLAFTDAGVDVVVDELPTPTVLMGLVDRGLGNRGVAVTTGPGSFEIFRMDDGSSLEEVGGDPGTGRGKLDFGMDEGGIPGLLPISSFSGMAFLVVEPGNHRISRWSPSRGDGTLQASGSVGTGSTRFLSSDANGDPGTSPGTFTGPVGAATDAERNIYVVDVAGGEEGGGRLQQLSSDGRVNWVMKLDFEPGGIAVDSTSGTIWITNRTRSTLMKFKL